MPKKAYKKKRQYLAAARDMARRGMVNQPDGTYKPYSQTRDDSMRRDYISGYHFPKI